MENEIHKSIKEYLEHESWFKPVPIEKPVEDPATDIPTDTKTPTEPSRLILNISDKKEKNGGENL